MGDIADMILDGILCENCGSYIDDDISNDGPGFPRLCEYCQAEQDNEQDDSDDVSDI